MPFYPKSQYQSGFFTNGNEYATGSPLGESYKGPYYTTSNGKTISGKSPSDTSPSSQQFLYKMSSKPTTSPLNSVEKLEGIDDPKVIIVTQKRGYIFNSPFSRNIPLKSSPRPNQKNYKLGIFKRYFCKKNNELKYFEINKETYNLLDSKDPSIAFDLYSAIELMWYLKGEKEQVFTLNKRLSESIEKKKKWPGFSQYFKEKFTQYYQTNPIQTNLYTSGGEFITPNGKEYIGYYHIHPDKGPMVGAVHVRKKHDLLTPIDSKLSPNNTLPEINLPEPSTPSTPQLPPPSMGGGGYSGGGGGY